MVTKKLLPVAAMERILKNQGAARVSYEAMEQLKESVEEYAQKIAKQAVELSRHAGRRTVKAADIKLAEKRNTD